MHIKLISLLIIISSLSIPLSAQTDFTNKDEAANIERGGRREGKWVLYLGKDHVITGKDMPDVAGYMLVVFHDDTALGSMVWSYYMSGKIWKEMPFVEGRQNGMTKTYSEKGELICTTPYVDDKRQGLETGYYPDGKVSFERYYERDRKVGVEKRYYEDGKLKREMLYRDGYPSGKPKNYDESGNEIR